MDKDKEIKMDPLEKELYDLKQKLKEKEIARKIVLRIQLGKRVERNRKRKKISKTSKKKNRK